MTIWALSNSVVNILGTTGMHLVEKLKVQSKAQLRGPTFYGISPVASGLLPVASLLCPPRAGPR